MIYDNPYFALYRHIIYRWKALELNLKNINTGDAPLLEVRLYWGIYGILVNSSCYNGRKPRETLITAQIFLCMPRLDWDLKGFATRIGAGMYQCVRACLNVPSTQPTGILHRVCLYCGRNHNIQSFGLAPFPGIRAHQDTA